MIYAPKGGMCCTCTRVHDTTCANLPFQNMPKYKVDPETNTTFVICSYYKRNKK